MYAECERYTGYLMNEAFVHLCTRGSIMANDVRREAIEDRLRRRRERDKIEEREKPDAQGLLNFACITHFPASLVASCILNGIGLPLNITVYTK